MGGRVQDDIVTSLHEHVIGIIGGTGAQGRGLATRWSACGLRVQIGSRDAKRAASAARAIDAGIPVMGGSNRDVATSSSIVVITVPWDAHYATVQELTGWVNGIVVVDCVNPLRFDKSGAFAIPVPEGSAAEQAASLLPHCSVVAAFHHVSAVTLLDLSVETIDTDVLVVGDDRAATRLVGALAETIPGVRGIQAGRLRTARHVEGLTANLIAVNRRYHAHAGLRVTDVQL